MTTKAVVAPTSNPPPAATGTASPPPPTLVSTPTGTLAITLTPPPAAPVPLLGNVVFWVSIISFVGVAASLWQAHQRMTRELLASDERLKKELTTSADESTIERNQSREQANLDRQHAAEQAHQERITKARREVYSAAVVAIVETQFYVANLPSSRYKDIDATDAFRKLGTALAQVSILGEMDTVILAREVQTHLAYLFEKARAKMLPIDALKDEIETLDTKLETFKAKVDQLDSTKGTVGEALAKMSEVYGNLAKCQQDRIESFQRLAVLNREYSTYVLVESRPIFDRFDELIELVRTELALDTELDRLRASTAHLYSSAMPGMSGPKASLDAQMVS